MNEALFARLASALDHEPVVLASVLATQGATPRKAGARMLIAAGWTAQSIGGGLAEARTIDAARALLAGGGERRELAIDLRGGAGTAGVCGGHMQLALRRWDRHDAPAARRIAARLAAGESLQLSAHDVGADAGAMRIEADPRLLIVGGGHCGAALYDLARHLDFELWIHDPRGEYADPARFPGARVSSGNFAALHDALATPRALYAVLLNRDYPSDVAALRVLAGHDYAFLGMMGSARRIHEVRSALGPALSASLAALHAPVGLPIGAQTPHEIAVSVLAQLLQRRAR
ncbi:MAG: XdhC family protein [Xanthomonadales bacterium]|nr:putative xanthine dehydrogenase subunit A [Xanthomonadales bacterium]MCC6591705.1 XdhC family protein [Xanthomonadales bacterium]MCE7931262.1 hypothetical protein [Xanthomonadales bacterium PRO6]